MLRHARKARILSRAVPKDLVNIWQCQQSTDPKWCPLIEISRTSVASHKCRRNAETLLQYIGLSPPVQGTNICRAPDNAPTRVDVASRYLGNKACKHETMKMSLPIEPQAAREVDYSKLRKFDLSHRTHNSCALPFSRRGVSASENISEVNNLRNRCGHQPKGCLNTIA